MPQNSLIILIGLMGSGKTTVGRRLARTMHYEFVDSDEEIERRTGANIPWIFDIEGEQGFRDREQTVIGDLCQRDNVVLATGGGAVLRTQNRQTMKSSGFVVYLWASPQMLYSRTGKDPNRPLLQTDDPLAKLENLYQQREPLYRETAHFVIDTEKQDIGNICRQVAARFRKRTGNENL